MIEYIEIEGICHACGRSIQKGDHFLASQLGTFYWMAPPTPASLLCASCINQIVKAELKYRREQAVRSLGLSWSWSQRVATYKEILMLQPRGPRVLVKRIDAPKPSSSTLIIPDSADGEKSCYAVVLAVGNKVSEDIKVADTVILASYCGSPVQVELEGEMLEAAIVMESDVLAVVED